MYWDHGKVNIVMLSAHQDVNECAPTPTKSLQLNRNEGVVIQKKQLVLFQLVLDTTHKNEARQDQSILQLVDNLRDLQLKRKAPLVTLPAGGNPGFPTPEGWWALKHYKIFVTQHYVIHLPDIHECLDLLKDKDATEIIASIELPPSWYKRKKFVVTRQSLKTLRQRWMVPNGGLCWLNDEVSSEWHMVIIIIATNF